AAPPSVSSFPTRRSSDLDAVVDGLAGQHLRQADGGQEAGHVAGVEPAAGGHRRLAAQGGPIAEQLLVGANGGFRTGEGRHVMSQDRKSTRLNSSHVAISY